MKGRKFDERTAEDEVDESDRHIEARDLKILVLKIFQFGFVK